jgi:hypothetical protein
VLLESCGGGRHRRFGIASDSKVRLVLPLSLCPIYTDGQADRQTDRQKYILHIRVQSRLKHCIQGPCSWHRLYEQQGEHDDAARVYSRIALRAEETGSVVSASDMSRCYRFLVLHHLKLTGDLEEAEKYAHKCCEFAEVRSIGQ